MNTTRLSFGTHSTMHEMSQNLDNLGSRYAKLRSVGMQTGIALQASCLQQTKGHIYVLKDWRLGWTQACLQASHRSKIVHADFRLSQDMMIEVRAYALLTWLGNTAWSILWLAETLLARLFLSYL
jgi:hypothetical protein